MRRWLLLVLILGLQDVRGAPQDDLQGCGTKIKALTEPEKKEDKCFHIATCPTDKCKCELVYPKCSKAVFCCNISSYSDLTEQLSCAVSNKYNVEVLHVRNATLNSFNISEAKWMKSLKHMSLVEGKINVINGFFTRASTVSCLNLSSNSITHIEDRSLVNLSKLQVLDLSYNNLTEIPNVKKQIRLNIYDNKKILCARVLTALGNKNVFLNRNETMCLSSKNFNWFNTTEEVPLVEVERYHNYLENTRDCTPNCSCEPLRMVIVAGTGPILTIKVNCSGKGLTELPQTVPPHTSALDISNNNITSLQPIAENPNYNTVKELYADNNQITSILPLEGSQFLNNFVRLSLRNNKITELPTYFLSNILDRNAKSRVNLGQNKVKCDCQTAKELKSWLLTKQQDIPDNGEIYCENIHNQKVIFLDVKNVCQSDHDWSDYIYYIITAEVLLLVLLIAKVSYDYWVFKTAGYLPWPASKMPKLPCDWLCE